MNINLNVKLLIKNLDQQDILRLQDKHNSKFYLGKIANVPPSFLDIPVDTFKYNGRLKRWEVEAREMYLHEVIEAHDGVKTEYMSAVEYNGMVYYVNTFYEESFPVWKTRVYATHLKCLCQFKTWIDFFDTVRSYTCLYCEMHKEEKDAEFAHYDVCNNLKFYFG